MAAGWMFWPALLAVLPKWLSKVRHHPGERTLFLRLLGRAVRDGLTRRTGVDHARVLALAGAEAPLSEPVSGSGFRGDTGPEGSAPVPGGRG